ncbi:phenylalanine--tRNA ligase [Starmerella bacillaris]|uniref:Phenylalanine--tRNA ligase, mitochondrial n=1 Tax=Starmerella bacillaris TaxID=1247836 RepID=A0AAV5RNL7_STABA|nr:phenylalanine--tRNA ligase [Starmerella bacillaris]
MSRLLVRFKSDLVIGSKKYITDEWTNVPTAITKLVGRNLYKQPSHPLAILAKRIEKRLEPLGFTSYKGFDPVVSVHQNFDSLGFPDDHPGRSKSDTYYINKDTLLRTHTSAHEIECFQTSPTPGYLITADVYRRDTIDRTHYPVFHQIEGARTWSSKDPQLIKRLQDDLAAIPRPNNIEVEDNLPPFSETNPKQDNQSDEVTRLIGENLKRTLEFIVADLFKTPSSTVDKMGKDKAKGISGGSPSEPAEKTKIRWVEAYFPWTSPSWEIEVFWKNEWLEVCGCGVVRQQVYDNSGMPDSVGWAFGIGLERSAMLLFKIPDIRLFWSSNPKFTDQFKEGEISEFQDWSKFPSSYKDIAFWNDSNLHENDVMEVVRTFGKDLVENVQLVDTYHNPKSKKTSVCYRITYQSMDKTLTNEEISTIQNQIIDTLTAKGAVIR